MAFDPKKPGNVELVAPAKKFRVVGVDTFEGPTEDYLIGDFDNLGKAAAEADKHTQDMNPCYVYNDQGEQVYTGKKRGK